jgi:glutamate/tyrosine decarboxylase-like PLP-dependent enzyme
MIHPLFHSDQEQLPQLLSATRDEALHFLQQLPDRPNNVEVPHLEAARLPETGMGALATLEQFKTRFSSVMVASPGPRYWGFVTGGTTPAALAGDWLTAVYDQNCQTMEGQGDISGLVEAETVALFRELLGLPDDFTGGFVTGATMSNFTGLAVGRQWLGQQLGHDVSLNGIQHPYRILSANAHSSAVKCLAMLGLGSSNLTVIGSLPGDREAIDIQQLIATIEQIKGEPFILIASAGTVNTVDFDDFEAIAALKKRFNFWLHIDAAFGGFAACSSQHQHLLKGWEHADSICVDGHKWLNVPYDSAVFFVRKEHALMQISTFQNGNAPYLGNPFEQFNYLNFLPENSRRLRALPAWFTLNAYGKMGYQNIIDRCIYLAHDLGQYIQQHPEFRLLAPVRLNTVCFTLTNAENDIATFLHRLNATGEVFMTPTRFKGQQGIRAALVNWQTTQSDVDRVKELLQQQFV